MVKKVNLFLFLQLFCFGAYSQYINNYHQKRISSDKDTIPIDTLSLIPGSISLFTNNQTTLDTSFYGINYPDGLLILNRKKINKSGITLDSISVNYKTFPFLFTSEVKRKDASKIRPDLLGGFSPYRYKAQEEDDIFKMQGLDKTGSISRGITIGNNQDMAVNSNLNLQLSGKLTNDIDILLAATDNNIPIQPEGNTQQLQEFDKVFIQVSNPSTKLIAGDFQLQRPDSYFMNFYKKSQGLSFSTALQNKPEAKLNGVYKTSLTAGISRGKFARNVIQGREANQGPYRLTGQENEAFIIVLSGTERVYIDGRLMDRGQENDYIIDYNTAEITFTAKQLITKDKRIVVEFQYSDKNYARSLIHYGNDYEQKNLKLHFHVYSEQDSKNQPLQQNLNDEQKKIMSEIGDTLSLSVFPSIDSVPFSNNEVLYQKTDTIIGTHKYSIFKYNADSANYRLTFSNVGQGNGNYVQQLPSSANGKVYRWVMPDTITNQPMGNYEPVIVLITPKQKQMITAGVDYAFSSNTKLSVETAMSKNDLNTFSSANSNDDLGYGLKLNLDNSSPVSRKSDKDSTASSVVLNTNVNYEYVQKNFSPLERYRNVEFERDWNRKNTAVLNDQNILGAGVALIQKGVAEIGYKINTFYESGNYKANKHNVNANYKKHGFSTEYKGSLLNSNSTYNTNFYRHKSGISQTMKWMVIGFKDELEQNKFTLTKKDSLINTSYKFWEWQSYIQNADTTRNKYGISYKRRTDDSVKYLLSTANLSRATIGETYSAFFDFNKNPNQQFKISSNYRTLQIIDTLLTSQKPEKTLLSRFEYNVRIMRGFISSASFYEIGSGLEVRKEFSFIEVAAGQGVYTWNDYNDNGIKELNEFEIATLPGTATFVKVYTPTRDYIKAYTNQFSQMLFLKPAAIWNNKTGVRKFISRFSNQSTYRVDRKSTNNDLADSYNPFNTRTQSSNITVNTSLRNTLFINQLSPVLGAELTYQDLRNVALLTNGYDFRKNQYKELKLRWNMTQQFYWNVDYRDGIKTLSSEYFTMRNYYITYYETEPRLSFQPNTAFRISVSYKYTIKKNSADLGAEQSILNNYGADIKYNVLQKGSLNAKVNYIQIKYNGAANTSLAFEMLDALQVGKNITWGLTYQRNLSNNMQLSLTYDGRQSGIGKIIHTGGAQVRAYF